MDLLFNLLDNFPAFIKALVDLFCTVLAYGLIALGGFGSFILGMVIAAYIFQKGLDMIGRFLNYLSDR